MAEQGFNLLQPQAPPPTFWDKAYAWVVGTARVIIIVVEIIVFGAFVARFVLDTQTKDLEQQIATQEVRLSALSSKEKYFREIQVKAAAHKKLWENASSYYSTIKELDTYLPLRTSDVSANIKEDTLLIRGFADLRTVSSMELSLKNSSTFKNTEVFEVQDQGGSSGSEGSFAVRAILTKFNSREF